MMAKKVARAKGKTKKASPKVGDLIPVSVTKAEEHWNIYELSDGTTLRARSLMVEIGRQHKKFDDKGNPAYTITGGMIYQVKSPKKMMKKKK